jgi:hypothetical protein
MFGEIKVPVPYKSLLTTAPTEERFGYLTLCEYGKELEPRLK